MDKTLPDLATAEAEAEIRDGMTVMIGGFGGKFAYQHLVGERRLGSGCGSA